MSKLLNAIKNGSDVARTANGAVTNATTMSANLDLFAIGASSRNTDITPTFRRALNENAEVALRILQWIRDVRGGAGERQTFRDLFLELIKLDYKVAELILWKTPIVGRWDDVLVALDTPLEPEVLNMVESELLYNTYGTRGLCAKWMPRQGKVAHKFRKHMGMSPKTWRKTLVELTDVVEQRMCANQWGVIEYGKLPSKAAANYQNAFMRHDPSGYQAYVDKLKSGEAKINASAIFPHDVVISMKSGNASVADSQWKSLPNYMEGSGENILPLVDVSASMSCRVGDNPNLRCMDLSIALGLYTSERMGGAFKGHFLTFSTSPELETVRGKTLQERYRNMGNANWGGRTDFQAAFDLILKKALQNGLSQEDLPTKVLVLSDMEFNIAELSFGIGRRNEGTNFEVLKEKFHKHGYKMPTLVFWNLNGRAGNMPVTVKDDNTALVSGFSPAILKSVLSGENLTPLDVMLDTVMDDRYNLPI